MRGIWYLFVIWCLAFGIYKYNPYSKTNLDIRQQMNPLRVSL